MSKRVIGVVAVSLLVLPFFALAQTSEELRAAIKADLMQDPRSADLSPEELDDLVAALAQETEAAGRADDYLAAPEAAPTNFGVQETGDRNPEWTYYVIILFSLAVALCGLYYIRSRRFHTDG